MAVIAEDTDRLTVSIGWSWFNGSTGVFDRTTGLATITGKNFFIPFSRTVRLDEIAEVRYVRQKSAAYPRIHLVDGKRIAMSSAGINDAKLVVPVIQRFLGIDPA